MKLSIKQFTTWGCNLDRQKTIETDCLELDMMVFNSQNQVVWPTSWQHCRPVHAKKRKQVVLLGYMASKLATYCNLLDRASKLA